MRDVQLLIKRLVDILFAGVMIAVLAPLLVLVAILIKIQSPGPVIFRQKRLGKDGKIFEVLKFRTMHHNAAPIKNRDGSLYTGEDDPRIYPIGRILRKTSLDELPQLGNILLGHMSLIGPRPDLPEHRALYEPGEETKLGLRPGMTGWAMVNGRNSIPWKERVRLDGWYVTHYSLWLDAQIFCLTFPTILTGRGVHQAATTEDTDK